MGGKRGSYKEYKKEIEKTKGGGLVGRVFLLVLDGFGVGAMPDAEKFGDAGSNTFGHILEKHPDLPLYNMQKMGLFNIIDSPRAVKSPRGGFGRMALASPNKDTTSGHWELSGLILDKAFPTFGEGFPDALMEAFSRETGYGYLGNKVASGTEIIKELGPEHQKTGKPIVYTSADSVFQIAAHEEVIPVDELYRICKIARGLLKDEWAVGRVIARPFIGKEGDYTRTHRRKDFSLEPPRKLLLDYLEEAGREVVVVGKLENIFEGRGISRSVPTQNNADGMEKLLEEAKNSRDDLIFTNLVDFDMLYGHRNNIDGFAQALLEFDEFLPSFLGEMGKEDILFITADHGTDPGFDTTDHTREYVPLLVWGPGLKENVNLGTRSTLADVGATIASYFALDCQIDGKSFWDQIKGKEE